MEGGPETGLHVDRTAHLKAAVSLASCWRDSGGHFSRLESGPNDLKGPFPILLVSESRIETRFCQVRRVTGSNFVALGELGTFRSHRSQ